MTDRQPGRRAHGELEAEVAAAVAAADVPLTVHEVGHVVDQDLSYTAVYTILSRLVGKGLLAKDRTDRGLVYRPAPTAATVLASQMDALLQRGPSRVAVLQSFLSTLDKSDEEYLRAWLDARRRGDGRCSPTSPWH